MRILFVCHRFPYPPNRGGKIRPFNMIRHLSAKHQVVVASLAHTEQELEQGGGLKDYCKEILAEVVPAPVRWAQAARATFGSKPSSVAYFWSARLQRKIEEVSRRQNFDAVIVHCAFAAQYAASVPAKLGLLDFGDLDSGKWFDYGQWRAFPLRYGYKLEARRLRRYETIIARRFNYCTVTTPGELEELKKLNLTVPYSVIPNGVDTTYFHPSGRSDNDNEAPVMVFIGRMDYFPNIDGVLYFTKEIFPRIRKSVPRAELRIVGSNPAPAIRKLCELPGVSVTGHVADVRPYLESACVSVAPLRIARGTQNKILESMAMGVPVVATPQAAKGIQAVPGRHLLVGDGAGDLAAKVVQLVLNHDLRAKLAKVGQLQVRESHSWSTSLRKLDQILDWMCSQLRTSACDQVKTVEVKGCH